MDPHISDQDLLTALDGEQSAPLMAEIQSHLAACWVCRTRSSEIEHAIRDFVRTYHRDLDRFLPCADGPRSLLKIRLADLAASSQGQGNRLFASLRNYRFIYACLAIALVVFAAGRLQQHVTRIDSAWSSSARGARFVPDPRLTPGATRPVNRDDVCSVRTADRDHFIPASLAKRVFDEYGVANPQPSAYEVDYLITPELGGADDIRNVWPEPYAGAEWNAHIKDALEEHLHQMVCGGELDLIAAQQDIARDWVSAYKKYFHTEHPLREHLTYTKDRPWE
jgi:hypothetical protein